jgi:hypothetical protein
LPLTAPLNVSVKRHQGEQHRHSYEAALQDTALLEINKEVIQLAVNLVQSHAVPKKAAQGALHIAIACVNGMDYLLTWNCKHIAKDPLIEIRASAIDFRSATRQIETVMVEIRDSLIEIRTVTMRVKAPRLRL